MREKAGRLRMALGIDWRLCFVADAVAAAGRDILYLIEQAVAGGATVIQLRGKTWTDREFLRTALATKKLLLPKKIPLIINDRVDIALCCGARGVHLGQDDLPLAAARKILGKEKIIGVSAATLAEALSAEKGGADYLGVGTIFPTVSKRDVTPPLGLEGLRKIREGVNIPILAIGGITASNAGRVIGAGADGVAVISAITGSKNPCQASSKLIEAIGNLRN